MSTPSFIGIHDLRSHPRPLGASVELSHDDVRPLVRTAREAEVEAIYRLVADNVSEGRLLPRTRDEIARRISRFLVAADGGRVIGCVDLAPLSRSVAEVRSLAVDDGVRSCGIGRALVREVERRAVASGFDALTAFTHTPGYFVHLGFSIVPHQWVPEKIEADCRTCAQFRRCGQYAVMLPLVRAQYPRGSGHSAHG